MPVTPQDFLSAAQALSAETSEIAHRSAISRAYYAAYHAAEQFHAALPMPGSAPAKVTGMHETLFHQLTNPSLKKEHPHWSVSRQIGYKARDLKPYRVKADYNLDVSLSSSDCEYVLEHTSRLFSLCRST